MAALAHLKDILADAQTVAPAEEAPLPTALVYSNEAEFDARWAAELANGPYHQRIARFAPLEIGRLPSGTVLRGEHHFLITWNGHVAIESVPHALVADAAMLDQAMARDLVLEEVEQECLTLTRYGHGTWGHWLGEILPIAALVEERFPRRFRYAVPRHGTGPYTEVMIQSLAAYGIETDRIVWLRQDRAHRLLRAWAMTAVWSDHAPHPAAMRALRSSPHLSPYKGHTKLALLRQDWTTRALANAEEVEGVLRSEGFHITDMAGRPFAEQVEAFRSAEIVFGVLGSGLTGLAYSPDLVRVVAASPSGFSDRFFYALVQARRGKWAEVKGATQWDGEGMMRDAPFEIPIPALRAALAHV
jgi:hypothetical protein